MKCIQRCLIYIFCIVFFIVLAGCSKSQATIYNNQGFVYYQQQKYDEALADYNKSIELNPNSDETYNNRGLIYYQQQKYNEALADFKKAVELDTNDTHASQDLKICEDKIKNIKRSS